MAKRNGDEYRWRETYFVWFPSSRRPPLTDVAEAIRRLNDRYDVAAGDADATGRIESLTMSSPDDHAALEIDFAAGDDILLEASAMCEELQSGEGVDADKLKLLPHCDARFEVMHFEHMFEGETEEESEEIFDPSALVAVMEALIRLTDGVGVDPQSGLMM